MGAAEGGSNYWAKIGEPQPASTNYNRIRVTEREAHEDGKRALNRIVTADDLLIGLGRLLAYPAPFVTAAQHLADVLNDNDDAVTADVVLQMTVFGEVIYG